jgi:hypothetical protein
MSGLFTATASSGGEGFERFFFWLELCTPFPDLHPSPGPPLTFVSCMHRGLIFWDPRELHEPSGGCLRRIGT